MLSLRKFLICLPLACIVFPAHAQVPFAANQDWRGSFACPSGTIAAHLHIDAVDKKADGVEGHALVRGVFTFGGSEKMPPVSHQVSGDYSPDKSSIKFTAGKWVVYPQAPISPAGFSLTVSDVGDLLAGQMAYGKCEALTLKRGASAAKR